MKQFWLNLWNLVRMRSLRARIFLILMVVGSIPSILMRYALISTYEDRAVEQQTQVLQNQLKILSNHLLTNHYLNYNEGKWDDVTNREMIEAELDMLSSIYEGRVIIIGKNYKVRKDTYGISEGKTMISEEVILCFQGQNTSHYDREHGYIELISPITNTTADGSSLVEGVLLVSVSNETIMATSAVLSSNSNTISVLMIVFVFALSMLVSRWLVKPLERVTTAIAEVKAGYSNEPISVPDYAETVHIVDAFNQLQRRTVALDESREEFVANVSHELKTPMTSIKVLSDSLLAQPDAPAELYREFMEDIASEIDRENRIITDLLALVKMDKKESVLNISTVNINELAELILKRLRPIARKKDVEVILESNREILAEVDEVKMTLVMTNLVENAIKYNYDHGMVRVILDADHQYFRFEVNDNGPGIPEDSLDHIFERFYRVDKSHSREIGGTGLGLSITRNAVLLHRGSITVTSKEGEGATFLVKIPLTYISPKT